MRRRTVMVLLLLMNGVVAYSGTALAQSPLDGRIVRVVYKVSYQGGAKTGTWGFHLAHMSDGQYCVRFGDSGRLALANIRRTHDICFGTLPGKTDRASERVVSHPNAGHLVPALGVTVFQKGRIELAGGDIVLHVDFCAEIEGEQGPRCFPNRYLVRISGESCTAEIKFWSPLSRALDPVCEHYKAE